MIRFLKNLIGRLFGYCDCPNCKDNLGWKGGVLFTYWRSEGWPYSSSGIYLCGECLSQPPSLDALVIAESLRRLGWSHDSRMIVKESVERFAREHAAQTSV